MKLLLLDIETAPNLAYVWGLWQQNIATNQIANSGYVMCWAAKWYGKRTIMFESVHKPGPSVMLERIHKLLDATDVVIHYNGTNFDIPTLNKEFLLHGMAPPAPYKQVDLYRVVKDRFRFPSNKMDYISKSLKIGEKVRHKGHELWVDCMNGDDAAWRKMEQYNRGDVRLLSKLYDHLIPWVRNHPNRSAYDDKAVCTNCGSKNFNHRGSAVARQLRYARYQCNDCGTWFRSSNSYSLIRKARHTEIV